MNPTRIPSRFLLALRDRNRWRRAVMLGLPVGLMQAGLNQGDHWWHHEVTPAVVAKTFLSPVLSCAIAFVSAAIADGSRTLDTSSP